MSLFKYISIKRDGIFTIQFSWIFNTRLFEYIQIRDY